jgi:hypothetical protein
MSDEWGHWVNHDGRSIPTDVPGSFVQATGHLYRWGHIRTDEGEVRTGISWLGFHNVFGPQIIRYRIRKPRALLDLIDLVENLPAPVRQPEGVP